MQETLIQEIMEYYRGERPLFYYFKDRYALMLLAYYARAGRSISQIKQSEFRRLLQKPALKALTRQSGNGRLTSDALNASWPEQPECFVVTFGKWGGRGKEDRFYNQTSRPGANLVLQLNFSQKHTGLYRRLIPPGETHPFECRCHPVSKGKYRTLAWVRLDIDYDHNEALIEEVQNDWIRMALKKKHIARDLLNNAFSEHAARRHKKHLDCNPEALLAYIDQALAPYIRIWSEAALSAAIWFLKEEIDIGTIYYHTFNTGCRLKRIEYAKPPKSIYTTLPEKFCFNKTDRVPGFLSAQKGKRMKTLLNKGRLCFYTLNL